MDALLSQLLSGPVDSTQISTQVSTPGSDLAAWWPRLGHATAGLGLPSERAIAGGFAADRLGYAFAAGYKEALRQLVPALGETRAAMCATEAGGVHPRAILTSLTAADDGFRLSGDKTWVTLGAHATVLLVIASAGIDPEGKNRLCLCLVPSTRQGVTLAEQPPTPFAPEIPHATLQLRDVYIGPEDRLPGDAYARYLKPFRTIEDLHVHAALLGWLLRVARDASWPRPLQEELVLLITAVRALCAMAPEDPALHLALGGLLSSCRRLLTQAEPHWHSVAESVRVRWQRDRPLLAVAGKARAQRLLVAWERLGAAAVP